MISAPPAVDTAVTAKPAQAPGASEPDGKLKDIPK